MPRSLLKQIAMLTSRKKKKFLSRLRSLFAENVQNRIREKFGRVIPYDQYTYGELTSEICAEGLTLCNDMKQRSLGSKEMRDFL